jgi:heat shock protein HslJ
MVFDFTLGQDAAKTDPETTDRTHPMPRPMTALLIAGIVAASAPLRAETPAMAPITLQPVTEVPADLRGDWRVVAIRDEAGMTAVAAEEPAMTIAFNGDGFGLSAGCNGVGGDLFARDGAHHVVGDTFSTMMLCPDPLTRQEKRLWQAFPEDGHYHRIGQYLYLFDRDGQLSLALSKTN